MKTDMQIGREADIADLRANRISFDNVKCIRLLEQLAANDRELEALREDRRRLDWLDKQKPSGWEEVLFEYHDGELVQVNFCHTDYDDYSQYYTGYTWRLAIDAALAAAPAEDGGRVTIADRDVAKADRERGMAAPEDEG